MDRVGREALPSLLEVSIHGAEVDIRCSLLSLARGPAWEQVGATLGLLDSLWFGSLPVGAILPDIFCRLGAGPASNSAPGGLFLSALLPTQNALLGTCKAELRGAAPPA